MYWNVATTLLVESCRALSEILGPDNGPARLKKLAPPLYLRGYLLDTALIFTRICAKKTLKNVTLNFKFRTNYREQKTGAFDW
jgi:hypothetical protein